MEQTWIRWSTMFLFQFSPGKWCADLRRMEFEIRVHCRCESTNPGNEPIAGRQLSLGLNGLSSNKWHKQWRMNINTVHNSQQYHCNARPSDRSGTRESSSPFTSLHQRLKAMGSWEASARFGAQFIWVSTYVTAHMHSSIIKEVIFPLHMKQSLSVWQVTLYRVSKHRWYLRASSLSFLSSCQDLIE